MAELKTKPTDASVADFIASIDEKRRPDCESLLAMMREISGDEPKMWGSSIIGFGDQHYKYASGREGDWFKIGFSPRKQALTLYVLWGLEGKDKLLQKLGKHKTGKGCLYVKKLADVDENVLRELIAMSYEHGGPC